MHHMIRQAPLSWHPLGRRCTEAFYRPESTPAAAPRYGASRTTVSVACPTSLVTRRLLRGCSPKTRPPAFADQQTLYSACGRAAMRRCLRAIPRYRASTPQTRPANRMPGSTDCDKLAGRPYRRDRGHGCRRCSQCGRTLSAARLRDRSERLAACCAQCTKECV